MPEPYANLGAEEGAIEAVPGDSSPIARLAMHFEAIVRRPPWRTLGDVAGVVAWINTVDAEVHARKLELPLWGASPSIVRRVHDKAFAVRTARRKGLVDDDVARTVTELDAHEVSAERVAQIIARWPSWARADATLKPRWGTSGRGRVRVQHGALDEAGRASLDGLRERGGCIVEPWLPRVHDLSSQWLVDDWGEVRLLGCTKMITRPSGVWMGCDIVRTDDGQGSGTEWDAELIAAARPLVEEAAHEGYVGVCGVDAFTWTKDGQERLRGVVELNARFTGGAVALATVYSQWGKATFRIQG